MVARCPQRFFLGVTNGERILRFGGRPFASFARDEGNDSRQRGARRPPVANGLLDRGASLKPGRRAGRHGRARMRPVRINGAARSIQRMAERRMRSRDFALQSPIFRIPSRVRKVEIGSRKRRGDGRCLSILGMRASRTQKEQGGGQADCPRPLRRETWPIARHVVHPPQTICIVRAINVGSRYNHIRLADGERVTVTISAARD